MDRQSSDDDLMLQVRDGDARALADLFDRHHVRLYNFFTRLSGRRDFAGDLVQEVFARMLKYRASYRPGARFAVWMYRIARNVFADHQGRRTEQASDAVAERESPDPSPFDRLAREQELDLLRDAFGQLPDEQREILLLVRFEGLRFAEIAELFGCSEGAAKVRAHRALGRLREIYFALTETRP